MAELSSQEEQQVQRPWGPGWGSRSGKAAAVQWSWAGLSGCLGISIWPGHTGSGTWASHAESPAEMWHGPGLGPQQDERAALRVHSEGWGPGPRRDTGGRGWWQRRETAVVRSGPEAGGGWRAAFLNAFEVDCRDRKELAALVRPWT